MCYLRLLYCFLWPNSSYSCINSEYSWCKSRCFGIFPLAVENIALFLHMSLLDIFGLSSVVHVLLGNFSFSQNLCSYWSKLSLLGMKNLILGTPSSAALRILFVKLDNFGAPSSYNGDKLQRTHQLLAGFQWSLVCWFFHLLTSNFPRYPRHYYLQMWME
jgi:hypothetical protein